MPDRTTKWRSEHGSNFVMGLIIMVGAVYGLNQAGNIEGAALPIVIGIAGLIFGALASLMSFIAIGENRVNFPFKDGLTGLIFLFMSFAAFNMSMGLLGGGTAPRVAIIIALALLMLMLIDVKDLKIPKKLLVLTLFVFAGWHISRIIFGDWLGNFIYDLEDDSLLVIFMEFWNNLWYESDSSWRDFVWWESFLYATEPAREWLAGGWRIVTEFLLIIWEFIRTVPWYMGLPIYLSFISAAIGIGYSHIAPTVATRRNWLKHQRLDLMYSYFTETGIHMVKVNHATSRVYLRDNTYIFTISGLTHRLGNYQNESNVLTFLLAIPYIPMLILTMIEMSIRVVVGTSYLIAVKLVHRVLLFMTKQITCALIPAAVAADRYMRRKQYCTKCYDEFNLPTFVCPECNTLHEQLTPGRCGILFAKCSCNNKFLPVMVFTGRSRLGCVCPSCKEEMADANARQFFVHLIGGSGSGKTAYMSAFANVYLRQSGSVYIRGRLEDSFVQLEAVAPSSDLVDYNFLHSYGNANKPAKNTLVVFDINGEQVVSEYHKNPRHFSFCNGFILFADPQSSDFGDVANQFILDYSGIMGQSANERSSIPVAVVVTKADVDEVKHGISGGSDRECKEYLESLGLGSGVMSIDAKFSNVRYFPISSTDTGKMPRITAPVSWIAGQVGGTMAKLFGSGGN